MQDSDFQFLATMLLAKSGLALTKDKIYLLESRLLPIARAHGLPDIPALVGKLRAPNNQAVTLEVVEAMTTNESMFFRDIKPFDQLRQVVLPKLIAENRHSLRIWSAAASTGQEPYTIAMCLKEEARLLGSKKVEILGTDIAEKVLERARSGVYTQFEVQRGLPIQMLLKYFKQLPENQWQVQDALRSMVQYRFFNLLDSFLPLGKFDIVFCRNVLIYFDEPTKAKVLNKIADLLNPPGYLYLGSAETVLGLCDRIKAVPGERGLFTLAGS